MRIGFIAFIIIILGILYLFFLSPVFMIKSFSVSSDNLTCSSADEIKSSIQINGVNFFFLKPGDLEKKIKDKFLCIGSVKLSKTIPDKISLELKNRQAVLNLIPNQASDSAIATDSGFLVDPEGVVFAKATFESRMQPIFFQENLFVGKNLGDQVKKVSQILETLKPLNVYPVGAKIYSNNLFSTGTAPQIILRLDDKLEHQLASLQLIINQAKIDGKELESVDLRFDKPIVRYVPKK